MKCVFIILAIMLLRYPVRGQVAMDPAIVGDETCHELSWNTSLNYHYRVDCSVDMKTWVWTGLEPEGTGLRLTYGFNCNADKMYYRIRASVDPNNGSFLTEPQEDDTINRIDGVCFAFDLNQLPTLPSKIRIFERHYGIGDNWKLIGSITSFGERQIPAEGIDERFFRGSAVWLPKEQGDYEIQAAAVDSAGSIIASAIRRITIGSRQNPTIAIVSGPSASSSAIPLEGQFVLEHSETVSKVEFYDNYRLIGTDTQPPFGDLVVDRQGEEVELLKGTHSIVIRGYDSTGAFTDTAPYVVTVTGGNARPALNVTGPASRLSIVVGDTFDIEYEPPTDADGFGDIRQVRATRFIVPFATHNDIPYPEQQIASDESAPFGDLTVDTAGWQPGTYTIKVAAVDAAVEQSYPHYFQVEVKSSATADFGGNLFSEIADEGTISHSAARFTGIELSSGIFQHAKSLMPPFLRQWQIDSGVLLTTGDFSLWDDGDSGFYHGNSPEQKGWQLSASGNPEIENRVAGSQTQDAAILEAEIFCENGQLEIEYQFASEEYDEFAAAGQYPDAFMIIVDGAVVSRSPDCAEIIAANTINLYQARHLFMGDDEDIDPLGLWHPQIEYDGLTVRLRAHVFVEPQSTHTVRIIICDVNDGIYDSGVFMETGSLRTTIPMP